MKPKILLFAAVFALGIMVSLPEKVSAVAPIGHFDAVTAEGKVEGWTARTDIPASIAESQLIVHVYINGPAGKGVLATSGIANLPRADVNAALGYAGNHGFSLSIPDQYKDGANHSVYVYAIGGYIGPNALLIGSPKTYNLGSSGGTTFRHPVGSLVISGGAVYYMDVNTRNPFPSAAVFNSYGYSFSSVFTTNSADLALAVGPVVPMKPTNTSGNKNPISTLDVVHQGTNTVQGWTIDPDNQNAAVQVEVHFDGPVGASTVKASAYGSANNPRPDVNSATGYSGNHGFNIAIPDSLKDGMSHAAYVYAVDVNTNTKVQFPGSPRSFVMENLASFSADIGADSTSITVGASTKLHWQVSPSLATVTISGLEPVSTAGNVTIMPTANTTYTLTANYNGQIITKSVTVSVDRSMPVITQLEVTYPLSNIYINPYTISWSVQNATLITMRETYSNGGYIDRTNLASSGSWTNNLNFTTTYVMTATNAMGSVQKTVTTK